MGGAILAAGGKEKVKWAKNHIDRIKNISSHLDGRFFDLVVTEHDLTQAEIDAPACSFVLLNNHGMVPADTKFHIAQLTDRPKQPIPEFFALLIGDVLHSLRSALDHLATGIIRTRSPAAHCYFPFGEERENLIANPSLAAIEQALPGAERLIIDKIKPYGTGDGEEPRSRQGR